MEPEYTFPHDTILEVIRWIICSIGIVIFLLAVFA